MKLEKLKQIIKEELNLIKEKEVRRVNDPSEWSRAQCSSSWETVTGMGGDPQGMSIFRKFCCRRGWKCCTRKRPKRNPCWD